ITQRRVTHLLAVGRRRGSRRCRGPLPQSDTGVREVGRAFRLECALFLSDFLSIFAWGQGNGSPYGECNRGTNDLVRSVGRESSGAILPARSGLSATSGLSSTGLLSSAGLSSAYRRRR